MHDFSKVSRRALLKSGAALTALTAIGNRSAFAAEPILVGSTLPLSGPLSLLGNSMNDGMSICFDEINKAGGVNGRKIELIAEDDAYETMRAIAAARKLIERDKVVALLASVGTANVGAIVPLAQESKMPVLFPYAFSNSLTNPTRPYVFSILPEARIQMNVLANYIVDTLKQTKVALIYMNNEIGQDSVLGLEQRLSKEKLVLTKLPFDQGITNFSGPVLQARSAGAEHVVFVGIPRDAAIILKEMNKLGWKPQFSGHTALGDPQAFQLAGSLLEGALAVAVMEPLDSDKPAVKAFVELLKKAKPNAAPSGFSLYGYNAAKLFISALEKADGRTDCDSLAAALNSFSNVQTGLMGGISFNANEHAGSSSCLILKAENGKWRPVTDWIKAA
jgi:branched-chain amino acid transport system substrate-binding protein